MKCVISYRYDSSNFEVNILTDFQLHTKHKSDYFLRVLLIVHSHCLYFRKKFIETETHKCSRHLFDDFGFNFLSLKQNNNRRLNHQLSSIPWTKITKLSSDVSCSLRKAFSYEFIWFMIGLQIGVDGMIVGSQKNDQLLLHGQALTKIRFYICITNKIPSI